MGVREPITPAGVFDQRQTVVAAVGAGFDILRPGGFGRAEDILPDLVFVTTQSRFFHCQGGDCLIVIQGGLADGSDDAATLNEAQFEQSLLGRNGTLHCLVHALEDPTGWLRPTEFVVDHFRQDLSDYRRDELVVGFHCRSSLHDSLFLLNLPGQTMKHQSATKANAAAQRIRHRILTQHSLPGIFAGKR